MPTLTKSVQDILDAADDAEPRLRAAIRRALQAMRAKVPNLEEMLAAGQIDQAIQAAAIPIPPEVVDTIRRALHTVSATTARRAAVNVNLAFNQVNPAVTRWAEQHAARLVTQITATNREAIRAAVTAALQEGIHPRITARHIETLIGLLPRHAAAVDRLFRSSITSGVTESHAAKVAARKADQLLTWRAEMIARTETITAANMGQHVTWQTATDLGLLQAPRTVWVATSDTRTCPICAALDGAVVDLGGSYTGINQVTTQTPTIHQSCRCTLTLQDPLL
jgi:SPP1 gp7 family putative phage head morphogenesis protein